MSNVIPTELGAGKFIVRASSLPSWSDCERRAAANSWPELFRENGYELRQLGRSIGAPIGTAVHAAASFTLFAVLRGAVCPDEREAAEVAAETLKVEAAAEEMIFDDTAPDVGASVDQAARMTRSWHAHRGVLLRPLMVEQRLEAAYSPTITVSGQADVYASERPGWNRLRDTKTGRRLPFADPQVGVYSLLQRSHGHHVDDVAIDFVPRVSRKKEQPPPEEHVLHAGSCESMAATMLRRIEDSLARFRADGDVNAWVPNGSSMLCNQKWCSLWGTRSCSAWKVRK